MRADRGGKPAKPVASICPRTGEVREYPSVSAAAFAMGTGRFAIRRALSKGGLSSGLRWVWRGEPDAR